MLRVVDIEFSQTQSRERHNEEGQITRRACHERGGLLRGHVIHAVERQRRYQTEGYHVGQRIELHPYGRGAVEKTCGETVAEVEQGGRHNEQHRRRKVVVCDKHHRRIRSAEQVSQRQQIRHRKELYLHPSISIKHLDNRQRYELFFILMHPVDIRLISKILQTVSRPV